jgi:glutamine amidotransferase
MIGVIDYGMGNLLSVQHALEYIGTAVKICTEPEDIFGVDRIVLPGVGAFADCMEAITTRGFAESLHHAVMRDGIPIIGICLGMQIMADRSFEGGEHRGLGWIEGDVIRIEPDNPDLRIPHIGWNEVNYCRESFLFRDLPVNPDFYFVHSYYISCKNATIVEATCDYGKTITAAIQKDNIFATQFHPEKSQDYGLRVLENFLQWNP